ncbi:hypothetical protein PAPYR_8891 [Paratrimastix pyriformis]|uniref:TM2 domain-containing protein n=1 Tax=Paratrimastix pyriformis TaxID=342808 RepID=A0ABQ8UGV4_9EUKA|nr:hypothetical protein PAPYR_8891 [Paratrimastix pyriformis]
MKDTGTAYALAALGLCGFCGLHRFYLERIPSGVVWLLTGGLCGIGQCVDCCQMQDLVDEANIREQNPPTMQAVPATGYVVYSQPQSPPMRYYPQA